MPELPDIAVYIDCLESRIVGAPLREARIAYAANETNYCAGCQTGGKILADRALSRLLKGDWPRSLEALDEAPGPAGPGLK